MKTCLFKNVTWFSKDVTYLSKDVIYVYLCDVKCCDFCGRYSTLIIKYNVAFWTKPWVAEWLRFLTSVLKVNRLTWGRVALPTLAVDNLQTGVSHFALSAIVSIPHTCDNRDLDNKLLKFTTKTNAFPCFWKYSDLLF